MYEDNATCSNHARQLRLSKNAERVVVEHKKCDRLAAKLLEFTWSRCSSHGVVRLRIPRARIRVRGAIRSAAACEARGEAACAARSSGESARRRSGRDRSAARAGFRRAPGRQRAPIGPERAVSGPVCRRSRRSKSGIHEA